MRLVFLCICGEWGAKQIWVFGVCCFCGVVMHLWWGAKQMPDSVAARWMKGRQRRHVAWSSRKKESSWLKTKEYTDTYKYKDTKGKTGLYNYNKVNSLFARYSPRATTTNQPTNRAPNEPARSDKNANFGPNLVILEQKILFFTGEIKSFVTHITENPPKQLVRCGFW